MKRSHGYHRCPVPYRSGPDCRQADADSLERLDRNGLLVLANHPTLVDVVLLVSRLPNADCVVKSRLANNPFTRGPVRATVYICNDNGAGLVDDCIASVRSGHNLLIFPEERHMQ